MKFSELRLPSSTCLQVLSGLLLATNAPAVVADTFDVYCVPSADGVSTCSGWRDGGTLTCVSSSGGVASCESSAGQQFTCTQDGSGVTTCQNPQGTTQSTSQNDDCTYVGNGSFSCGNQPDKSPDLIPSPNISDDPIDIPNDDLKITIPSLIP